MNEQEFLTGVIERITYHSESTGFCVLRVDVKGRAELVTVVGNAAQVTPGEYINCHGSWIQNRDYGLQFKANTLSMLLPSTTEGLQKYLGSGLIKGIGPHFSKQLITAFGDQIFDIIENHPEKLHQVTGIGEQRVNMITHSWKTQRVVREIMVFLQEYGVGTARAVRIYKTYGSQSIAKVRENPYCLALDIHGIGFKTADALAQRLGIEKESQIRAEAGVRHVLQEFSGLGHCAVLQADLVEKAQTLLEIPAEIIERALTQEISSKRVVSEHYTEGVYLALSHLYRAELGVVKHIKRLLRYPAMWLYPTPEACDLIQTQIEHTLACRLSVSQHHAMQIALQNKLMIITGGPGVGKTTLVNSILHAVRAQGARIVLCAPTGRAAKRLSESTGLEAKTLHRLLEFDPKERVFKRSENQPLEADLIVIDEMSMVDITMMHHLLSALPNACGVLFVGDVDQLPSVGPGAVLRDLIGAQTIPMVKLTEIFRQAAHSQIILAAHKMNQGVMPLLENTKEQLSDFYFIACETPEEIHARLMEVVMHRIPKRFGFHPIRQIQVLVPMTRGSLGVRSLNVEL
jgi:exodeoxyribonuclease V alpha subunit